MIVLHRMIASLTWAGRPLFLAGLLLAASAEQAAAGVVASPAMFRLPVAFLLFGGGLLQSAVKSQGSGR